MVGQNIGKYRILDRLGRGGMGTVYRAIDETLRREVAIKVLNTDLNDPAVARRFRAEAVTVARLSHPGIATIFELFQHDGEWLMVMEFVRGETLEALVAKNGPLPVAEAVDLSMQTLAALAHAHSLGVVHRDLKPANVMVSESKTVKVMDFGIARVVGSEHLTSAGFMMGTPAYMAPEQVLGQDIDARTDLYAVAVVLFYLLTAKLPFKGQTPFEMAQSRLRDEPIPVHGVRPDLPLWLGEIFKVTLARQPEKRYQTAALFRDALARGLANLPLETQGLAEMPPELVVTAVPGSMRIATIEAPAATTVPQSDTVVLEVPDAAGPAAPTVAHVPVPSHAPSIASPAARQSNIAGRIGLAAAIVATIGAGTWLIVRSHSGAPTVATVAETARAETPAAQTEIEPPASPASPPVTTAEPASLTVPAAPVSTGMPGPAAGSTVGASGAPTTSARAAAAAPPRAGATAASLRPSAVEDAPASFADVRLLVVSGKKAEERQVVLKFAEGSVTAADPRGGVAVQSLPYRDISYAIYVRAKDPKWSVVLASPPHDVDFPGGLFRSSRRWLTLQSRAAFMIVRLNDSDWRKVIDLAAARTGVSVEQPATSQ